jgi:excisionase family DNA binding protein
MTQYESFRHFLRNVRDISDLIVYGPTMSDTSADQLVPTLFDFQQAARRLNVTESYLRRGVTARTLPHRRIGRKVMFSIDDLRQIVTASAVTPADAPTTLRPRRRRAS